MTVGTLGRMWVCVLVCAWLGAEAARPATPNLRYAMQGYVPIPLGTCSGMNLGCIGVYGIDWLSDGRMVLLTSDAVFQGNMPYPGSARSKVTLLHGFGGQDSLYVQDIATGFKLPTGLVVVNDTIYVADMDTFYRVPTNSPMLDSASLFNNREARLQMPTPSLYNGHLAPFNFRFPAPQQGPSGGITGSPPGGWTDQNSFWHQYMYSPYYHQGKIHAAYSGATFAGGGFATLDPVSFFSGSILVFEPGVTQWDTSTHRAAGGIRSPGGFGKGPDFALVSDNQGGYRPLEELFPVKAFTNQYFGYRQGPGYTPNWGQAAFDLGGLQYEPSVAVMDFSEQGWRSAAQPMYIPAGPYAGNWLVGSINSRGIARVAFDSLPDTNGVMRVQGAAFWFVGHHADPAIGTASHAINRLAYGPDGAIYAGTLRNIGNWATGNNVFQTPRSQLLYRFVPDTAARQFEVLKVRSLVDGYELILSEKVDPDSVSVANFTVQQRRWVRQLQYGGGLNAFVNRPVASVAVSADSLRIHLAVPGIRRLNQEPRGDTTTHWYTKFAFNNLKSADGLPNFTDEATYVQNWISPRTWEPGDPTRVTGASPVSPLASRVWFDRSPGLLRVHVDVMHPYQVALGDVKGRVLARRNGSGGGSVEFRLPSGTKGVHVVEVRSGADVYRKAVSF